VAGSNTSWFWRWSFRYFGGFALLLLAFCGIVMLPEIFPDHGVFYHAILDGDIERVQTLLDRGGDPNSQSSVLSDTVRHIGGTSNVGASVNWGKQTPLVIVAISKEQYAIAKLLLERGADPNAQDGVGHSVLAYAATGDDIDLVRLLLSMGADPGTQANDGSTALREGPALRRQYRPVHQEIIRLLEAAQKHKP
jgi:Ankyrin repeats (3 copies)